jgi:hypothetical protein
MLLLKNDTLAVVVLDPVADRDRLGPRFTTGGYVYQVRDSRVGDLLSGPEYPAGRPSVLNGQGLPEVFQFTLFENEAEIPEKKLVIGVGIVENSVRRTAAQSHFDAKVEEFCAWEVERSPCLVTMETAQGYGPWSLLLRKTVRLEGRTLKLVSELSNSGGGPLPFRWFAHPFFPLPPDGKCSVFPDDISLNDNPGFALGEGGVLAMKKSMDWAKGHFEIADLAGRCEPLHWRQFHPRGTNVEVECSFAPTKLAFWANDRTCSVEPFASGTLGAGRRASWEIAYTFGEAVT